MISDPNMKLHNNTFSRYREQLFAETTQTDRHTDISLGVFSFITLLEMYATKIWRDLDQCTDKTLILYI